MKIVLFGDSMLARFGKERLEELESKIPQSDVYNCAVGGWDSNDGVKKAPYIALLKPDVVVISLGTNDAAPWKQVPVETFKSNLGIILAEFKGSRIIFFPPCPVDESKQKDGYKRTNALTKLYFDAAMLVCNEEKVSCIDSWAIFGSLLEQGKSIYVDDGLHLNDYGNSVLTETIVEALGLVATV